MATINAPCFSLAGFVLLSAQSDRASGFPTNRSHQTKAVSTEFRRSLELYEETAVFQTHLEEFVLIEIWVVLKSHLVAGDFAEAECVGSVVVTIKHQNCFLPCG